MEVVRQSLIHCNENKTETTLKSLHAPKLMTHKNYNENIVNWIGWQERIFFWEAIAYFWFLMVF